MAKRTVQVPRVSTRAASIRSDAIDQEKRTVALTFSSEIEVRQYWGWEILSHDPDAVDLSWFREGRGVLLKDHNRTQQIGVVENAEIADRKGRATVRFSREEPAAGVFRDVVDDIRRNVSVGYEIHEMREVGIKDDVPVFMVTRWTPLEISSVAIPADGTVGIGRSIDGVETVDLVVETANEGNRNMDPNNPTPAPAPEPAPAPAPNATRAAPSPNPVDDTRRINEERARIREIVTASTFYNVERAAVDKAINDGWSADRFKAWMLEQVRENAIRPIAGGAPLSEIGMSPTETERYSIGRAVRAYLAKDWRGAGLELEASRAIQDAVGREPQGFYLPREIQDRNRAARNGAPVGERATMVVGTPSAGGYLVGTDHLGGSFIDALYARMLVRRMGATILDGLVGNIDIPKLVTPATGTWSAEDSAPSEAGQVVGQLLLSPKSVRAWRAYSRRLLHQSSPSVDRMLERDLGVSLALAIDKAALHGAGGGTEPTGIAATVGIGSVSMGSPDGGAPTWPKVVELETAVATANADMGSLGYLTSAKGRGKLKTVEKASGTAKFLWDDAMDAALAREGFGSMNGYPAGATTQVSSTLTEGGSGATLSALFFANWQELVIAEWGVVDIIVDPFSGATAGNFRIVADMMADVGVRHAQSFAAALDMVTT